MADFPSKFADLDYGFSSFTYGNYEQNISNYCNYQEFSNSDCLSSVMNCLPTSTECSACPLSVSKFFYSDISYAQLFDGSHDYKNSSVSGRSSAPPRVLSEPPNFYSTPRKTTFKFQDEEKSSGRNSAPPPSLDTSLDINIPSLEVAKKPIARELEEGEYQISHKEACSQFSEKIMCFFVKNGTAPLDCSICEDTTTLKILPGKNAQTVCNHFIPCNECRGRTVRRLLRCISCCIELASEFPVCGDNCVNTERGKETLNTGTCPRCDKKLRREICGPGCNRRNSDDYLKLRAKLNEKVAVLVLNPSDCLTNTKSGVSRPCSHYSYCESHNIICKGHGRDTTCRLCRGKKKLEKRRASMDLETVPPKRQCLRKIG